MKKQVLVLVLILLLRLSSPAQSLCFYDAIGNGPLQVSGATSNGGIYGIASGDFNEDGIMDIATANGATGNISVLFGNLNGIFEPPVNYPGNDVVMADIAAVDINNDTILDLVASGYGWVLTYRGNGDGTFGTIDTFVANAETLTYADFNGDGYIDFATAYGGNTAVAVLINNGDGTFAPTAYYYSGEVWGITNGDFNNDSIPDLAVTGTFTQVIGVLYGNGNGTFGAPFSIPLAFSPLAITTYDLNADGNMDIITSNFLDANISIIYGNGDGTFQPEVDIEPGFYQVSYTTIKDLNNDSFPDLVLAVYDSNGFGFMLNDGTNNFLPPGYYIAAVDPIDLEVFDMNNDGYFDVITPASSGPYFSCHINCSFTGIPLFTDEPSLQIFPNPATDYAEINLTGINSLKFSFEIFDLLGHKLNVPFQASTKSIRLDLYSLPKGIYLVQVIADKRFFTQQFLKQ